MRIHQTQLFKLNFDNVQTIKLWPKIVQFRGFTLGNCKIGEIKTDILSIIWCF